MELPEIVSTHCIQELIRRALEEDIGPGDVTSECMVGPDAQATGHIVARQHCILSGAPIVRSVFQHVDPSISASILVGDGTAVDAGRQVLEITGLARALLAAERVALNFLQRLSGIATLTHAFVQRAGTVQILDTRKTTPGLRILEKYAVRCGGGRNHRMGLYDRILIKDNHLAVFRQQGGRDLAEAIEKSRAKYPGMLLEVEVDDLAQLDEVLAARPDWVLLDNMNEDELRDGAARCKGRCKVEASGAITLDTIDGVVRSGVDAVSLGALTHSAPAADFSLEFEVRDGRA